MIRIITDRSIIRNERLTPFPKTVNSNQSALQDTPVTVMRIDKEDFICLTDMAKARTDASCAADVIKNWLRSRSALIFLGTLEVMYSSGFKVVEFDPFKTETRMNRSLT